MDKPDTDGKRRNLSAGLVATLKERIVRWEYPPGHRFTEEGLCQEFGVSRSPVREALRVLAVKGFLDKIPHQGYTVKQLDINEIDELYEVRLALELYVVESLAKRGMPEKDREDLFQTWDAPLEELPREGEDLAVMDERFHDTLAQATGNKTLLHHLRAINERLHIFRMTDFTVTERVARTCWQHLEILERIEAKDVAGAREAVRTNIEESRNNVETTIKEALARAYLIRSATSRPST